MCANVTSQASPSPTASTGRSLFSRLTAPLRSHTKYFSDFHILTLEPHRKYAPGDVVKGLVVLTIVKPLLITHLTVALHGFVRVYKNQNAIVDNTTYEPALTGSSRNAQYFGNGHASLFQDEVTLCGEGRLEPGVYEFEFNLDFPRSGLPTSIDFERGTISYIIRATITRPTSIAATSSCDRKISLIETIDIGPMNPPKPNIISLEPIPKRSKKTVKPKPKTDSDAANVGSAPDSTQPADSRIPDESSSQRASADHSGIPRSPVSTNVQSEASAESVTSSKQSQVLGPSTKSGRDIQDNLSSCSRASNTITAKIELLKGGCLPGHNIPLKVTIQHTKRIKSMNGVIVTLYRQGRIDSAPPLSLFTDIKGKATEKLKHEEYFPKSKTGLSGLSLSSAGSSSVFRKDLSQTVTPIIVDPQSFCAVVTASVRVPEDAFPTIAGVPGQMISFRYHIEVVVDLGGKLAGHKQLQRNILPNFGLNGNLMFGRDDVSAGALSAWGGSIVDTDYIRREKGVVACLFEVIVGTMDSSRFKGSEIPNERQDSSIEQPDNPHGSRQFRAPSLPVERVYDHPSGHNPTRTSAGPPPQHPYAFVPSPEMPREDLNEKDRIRLAEERLLPSRPPQGYGPLMTASTIPSAPDDPTGELCEYDNSSVPPSHPIIIASGAGSSNLIHSPLDLTPAPSAPALEDLIPHATPSINEDKQELKRRHLMAETSSPSDLSENEEGAGEASRAQYEPTAPVLTEEEEYEGHYAATHPSGYNEFPPKYER